MGVGGGGNGSNSITGKLRVINGRNLHLGGLVMMQRNRKVCPFMKKMESVGMEKNEKGTEFKGSA